MTSSAGVGACDVSDVEGGEDSGQGAATSARQRVHLDTYASGIYRTRRGREGEE